MSDPFQQLGRIGRMIPILLLVLAGSACSLDKALPIDPGRYLAGGPAETAPGSPGMWIEEIAIDDRLLEVTFFPRKGSPLVIPYAPRPWEDWPVGCPGNLYAQRMEVLDLQVTGETAGILGFLDPILVRNCPEDPYQLVLREDGEIGGASTACPFTGQCLIFTVAGEGWERPCESLELIVEEMDREQAALEDWAAALVDGYGPGVWYFSPLERPTFHHAPEQLTLEGIVRDLNQLFTADQIPTIQVEGQLGATIKVSLSDDRQLTQRMGSAGAQGYLQVVLYSLASLPAIDCVDFQFQEGDHAQPGTLCRVGSTERRSIPSR